jgi:hypothetical protein
MLLAGGGYKPLADFAEADHTHSYAGSSTAGGPATKVVCSAATSDTNRPILVTNESNGLCYTTKVKLNYSTGNITAPTFTGNLVGNADTATTMSSFTTASGDSTKRYVWMSWNDNTGKPAYTDKLTFQTSTNTLFVNDKAVSLAGHTHSSVNDSSSGAATTFAYSKSGLDYGDYTWLAGWNGYELRAVNKSQFAQAIHTHTKSQITDFPSSMPASDVYAWAKAATKPSYTASEVGLGNVANYGLYDSTNYSTSAGYAFINSGIMEVGNRIDFHSVTGSNDYEVSLRIQSGENTKRKIYFPASEGTLALTSQIPSALKNPKKLTIFGVEYDGSADKTVTSTTMISTLSEGTSDITDKTEILTSYASDNGFADTNAPNVVYKRDAVKLYNYINAKLAATYAGLNKTGTVTSVAIANGGGINVSGSPITSSGTITLSNAGVRSVTIGTGDNVSKLAVNTNGTTKYLTIPYATSADVANSAGYANEAGSAVALSNSRKISLSGAVTGSASFDGSANITIATTNDSSVSGGGSNWGSSITVKINGTEKKLTIPAKPTIPTVTDYYWADIKVSKSASTTTTPTFSNVFLNGTLTLLGTTSENARIKFSRGSSNNIYPYNYITAPTGGIISIEPGGLDCSSATGY